MGANQWRAVRLHLLAMLGLSHTAVAAPPTPRTSASIDTRCGQDQVWLQACQPTQPLQPTETAKPKICEEKIGENASWMFPRVLLENSEKDLLKGL